jgi:hypothetical protein
MEHIEHDNLQSLNESKEFQNLGGLMKDYLLKAAKSQVNMSREVKLYSPLLSIIKFDKISDMIFFMTSKEMYRHYIAQSQAYKLVASTEGINSALNQANQQARKDSFESKYPELVNNETLTIRRITTSFDKVDAISSYLFSMMEGKVKINSRLGLMIVDVVDEDGKHSIETIANYSKFSLAFFISQMLMTVMNLSEAEKVAEKIEGLLSLYGKTGTIIQFNDCYVKDGYVYQGFFEDVDLPRFFIDRNVYDAVLKGEPIHRVQAVDDLLMNLCNFDEATFRRILSVMSTIFFNNEDLKTKFNSSIRFVGKDGRNGKSIFSALMRRAFGKSNCHIFSIADLSDSKTLYAVANALVAIDSDSTGKTISDDSSALFKSLTSGESIEVKGLYKQSEMIQTCCSIIAFSNMMPNSSDKTTAYLRRLEIVSCNYQILNPQDKVGPNSKETLIDVNEDWFDSLRKDEAAQYLIELLLIESQRLIRAGHYPEKPKSMELVLQMFAEENDSASAFVHEAGLEEIVGYSIAEVRQKYHEWCESNDMSELKRKFNETLTDRFGLKSGMATLATMNLSSEAYLQVLSGSKKQIRCWQLSTNEKTIEFLESQTKKEDAKDVSSKE